MTLLLIMLIFACLSKFPCLEYPMHPKGEFDTIVCTCVVSGAVFFK